MRFLACTEIAKPLHLSRLSGTLTPEIENNMGARMRRGSAKRLQDRAGCARACSSIVERLSCASSDPDQVHENVAEAWRDSGFRLATLRTRPSSLAKFC
jgi:hypothetical protein